MADNNAISLKDVSKVFKRYQRPADRLKEILLPGKSYAQEFCALKNISLDIPRGETWGIVGRNGAGKSTLLKIITGTLQPTSGTLQVNGRVSALLELGSGFNPEFTGRQNVFFNGRLLGLSQLEVEQRFEDIVAFADIGDFLEQPVKTYSSGMRARLAFAVASSVEPDVLIVDEVLAVGDAAFQRKCFARMERIRDKGCTILFVSHSISSVVELCDRGVLIDNGENLLVDDAKNVTSEYQRLIYAPKKDVSIIKQELRQKAISGSQKREILSGITDSKRLENINKQGFEKTTKLEEYFDPNFKPKSTTEYISNGAKISNVRILNSLGEQVNVLLPMQTYSYVYEVLVYKRAYKVRCGMLTKTIHGVELGGMTTHPLPDEGIDVVEPNTRLHVKFDFKALMCPGNYFINAGISGYLDLENGNRAHLHRIFDAAIFRVAPYSERKVVGLIDISISDRRFLSMSK